MSRTSKVAPATWFLGRRHAQGEGAALLGRGLDAARAIDVAAHHVAAHRVAEAQGGFQVHAAAGGQGAERRAG
jgi:hypothetical protein